MAGPDEVWLLFLTALADLCPSAAQNPASERRGPQFRVKLEVSANWGGGSYGMTVVEYSLGHAGFISSTIFWGPYMREPIILGPLRCCWLLGTPACQNKTKTVPLERFVAECSDAKPLSGSELLQTPG